MAGLISKAPEPVLLRHKLLIRAGKRRCQRFALCEQLTHLVASVDALKKHHGAPPVPRFSPRRRYERIMLGGCRLRAKTLGPLSGSGSFNQAAFAADIVQCRLH